ncbi:MAG: hypothetical protein CAF44_012790 [Nitrospira sp. CG24D]|nr:MAG: hypothetical protein CAF44_012790 [Nitrospira sp. CG24D]
MASPSHASEYPQYDAQSLLNSQPVIVTVIDPSTHQIQFQNQTGLNKFGDITGQACYDKIAGCRTPCDFCRMPEAMASDTVVSSEVPLAGIVIVCIMLISGLMVAYPIQPSVARSERHL